MLRFTERLRPNQPEIRHCKRANSGRESDYLLDISPLVSTSVLENDNDPYPVMHLQQYYPY